MSLLDEVVAALDRERIPYALIGATALALHGVSRSTADVDLLTVDGRVLREEPWAGLQSQGVEARVVKGDADDPLAGSVRLSLAAEVVDIVVGRHDWQREIVEAAVRRSLGACELPVVEPLGLILLKLYAGGPKDAWDVRSLLEVVAEPEAVAARVDSQVTRLPLEARRLWQRIRGEA